MFRLKFLINIALLVESERDEHSATIIYGKISTDCWRWRQSLLRTIMTRRLFVDGKKWIDEKLWETRWKLPLTIKRCSAFCRRVWQKGQHGKVFPSGLSGWRIFKEVFWGKGKLRRVLWSLNSHWEISKKFLLIGKTCFCGLNFWHKWLKEENIWAWPIIYAKKIEKIL